jgi:thiol-disulfide isomerase/thioredoxin
MLQQDNSVLKKLFIVIVFCVISAGCSQDKNATFYDNKGNQIQLSKLQGKWVILNFWASWCPSCREEVPMFNRLNKKIAGSSILLYGIEAENLSPDDQDTAIQKVGMEYPVLRQDPSDSWGIERIEVIPTTVIINPRGKVVATYKGVMDGDKLLKDISALQNEDT